MTKAPDFYDPNRIGALFHPNMAAIAEAAAGAALPPAAEDAVQRHLLIIDMQIDFCHVNGSLYVPGALEDIRNTIEFIYANAEKISRITCSLDSHLPTQIFAPAWWADAGGNHPAPFTLISAADVESGRWRALQAPEWSAEYVRRLEQEARKQLTIWPYHVLIGSIGNAMDPELWSAIFWHSLARKVEPHFLQKGTVPRTEHYSIIQPEVPIPGEAAAQKNQRLVDLLGAADEIIIAGEAETHCVLESVEDIVEEFRGAPELVAKVRFLRDCTSPVLHPEIDFHALAQARFEEFAALGMRFEESTTEL